jgi:hypothetical protein
LNGAKRLNDWNDWNGCSFIHRVSIVRDGHEHDHEDEHGFVCARTTITVVLPSRSRLFSYTITSHEHGGYG